MIDALGSTLLGAVAGGAVSWFLTLWQMRRERSERVKDAQLDLVRRIVRNKSGGAELASALNEVPVVFSGDDRALSLYLAVIPECGGKANTELVIDLLVHLASSVGLRVDQEHLVKGFQ
ncbi:hypothetical protein [Tessaracoccus sp. OH4464_COT-324]|uniref:hypothetical protein n=1 Tax=Tessaracoccus sp. OH4464_COT-324 TaxID=2491059 RepID=UPI000F6424BA|nr:hypothetical protein [Tessaracoccus sp. OH4464_COT-324]RRD46501.1 hypothetical protein EII42_06820 [Tessaracoccus sp. OH4464_COT-324]